MSVAGHAATANGRIGPEQTVTRVMLRPIGSSLPLGS